MKRVWRTICLIMLLISLMPLSVFADFDNYAFDEFGMKKEKKLRKSEVGNVDWIEFTEKSDIPLTKEWTVEFSGEVTKDKIDGMVIEKGDSFIPVKIELTGSNEATVTPVDSYDANSTYCLKIFLNNGNRYKMYFNTIEEGIQEPGSANEYIVKDENAKALYSLKINKITTMSERNQFSDKDPAQVILIDYTYTNIASVEDVYLYDSHFKVIDSSGKIGYTYPNSKTYYPQKVPIGVTCDAQMIFGINTVSDIVDIYFYEGIFDDSAAAVFEIHVD